MTSGNRSDEPIAYEDDDARERLSGIADVFLTHDRPIHLRCDDSVTRVRRRRRSCRSGGRAAMPRSHWLCRCRVARPTLGARRPVEGDLRPRPRAARVPEPSLGDLDHYEAYRAYVEAIEHYERLFAMRPELIVHDLHPDYASTRYARAARRARSRLLAVQHHHAHVASCMAENGLDEPVIGVAFDGTGYGTDGAIWGGEFLTGDYRGFRRAAHLRYVAMPGGEQAIREPWRMAAAYLARRGAGATTLLADRVPATALATVRRLIDRRFNCADDLQRGPALRRGGGPGRRPRSGQLRGAGRDGARMAGHATSRPMASTRSRFWRSPDGGRSAGPIDTRPLIAEVAAERRRGVTAAVIARRFHSTLVEIDRQVCAPAAGARPGWTRWS